MKLAHDSGFRAIVLSAVWKNGASAADDVPPLRRAVDAAVRDADRPVLAVYQLSSLDARRSSTARGVRRVRRRTRQGAAEVRDVIVGNEPNLNLFWQPQFDATGGDQAAPRL